MKGSIKGPLRPNLDLVDHADSWTSCLGRARLVAARCLPFRSPGPAKRARDAAETHEAEAGTSVKGLLCLCSWQVFGMS